MLTLLALVCCVEIFLEPVNEFTEEAQRILFDFWLSGTLMRALFPN